MTEQSVAVDPGYSDIQQALRRVARSISAAEPLSSTLHLITSEAAALTRSSTAAIGLREDDGRMLEFKAAYGDRAVEMRGLRVIAEHSLAESAIRTGRPALLTQQPFPDSTSVMGGYHSAAVVPINRDGRVVGAIFCTNRTDGESFGDQDTMALGALAEHTALALVVDEGRRSIAQKSRELSVLYDTARTVSGTLSVPEVLNSLLDTVCDHFEHHAAALFLLNDEHTHLFIAAERGLNDDEREIQLSAQDAAISSVLQDRRAALCRFNSAEGGTSALKISERTQSALVVPVRSRNDTLGILIVASTQLEVYQEADLNLLTAVGAHSGIAIANAWLYEDAMRQAEEAGALYDLSQHVNASLHLDRVLQFVADSVVNVLKVEKFALMLADPQTGSLSTRVGRGIDEERFARIRPKTGQGIPGWVYEWMTPTAVADIAADARNASAPIDVEDATSAICVPMAVGNEVMGVMLAMSVRRRFFTVAEMELLYTIANQAAVAIANATLYRDARSKSTEMRRYFNRVAKALGSALEAKDLPQLLADLVVEVMRADRCAIYRSDGEVVRLHATSNFRAVSPPDSEVTVGDGLTGWVARKGKALAVRTVSEDARSKVHLWLSRERLASYLAVPLKLGRKTVGVVEIFTQEPRAFSEEEIKLLAQFARRARVAERLEFDTV
jgi:GAF domain-containing protein